MANVGAAALTPKQEAFCQRYLETGNASQAYRLSYDAGGMKTESIHRKAKELLDNGKIAARLTELRGKAEQAHAVTMASLMAELEEARGVARRKEQATAMVQATMGKAKLAGLDRDAALDDTPPPDSVTVTVVSGRKQSVGRADP
ncbi:MULTISPECIES: terminase small subunit [Xanthomonas]|uniref:Terminase small subunit n=1 Tax=Xanthomonas dyei TaxID=743699 RepID=A0ABZ0D3J0_9XANT|nr:terminase small subunit [Xanthomonas dyei]WOB24758.1 terminase small subunit [Xanthomonas dyei]WOB52386.1 terminase small subunit [Xanthomonas dyei]